MIDYVTLGVRDLAAAGRFYDPLPAALGYARGYQDDDVISWGDLGDPASPRVFVCLPFDGGLATPGNGTMLALRAPDRATVDRMHALALTHGGRDEGAPGLRVDRYGPRFYVAYARDPAGNKLAFAHTTPAAG